MRRIFTFLLQKFHYVVFVFLFGLGLSGFYSANSQTTFNTAGTYTFRVTSQSNGVVLEVWGAGGSGGNGSATGGGGGGGYSRTTVNLAPGDYTVIVGAGGTFNGTIQNGGGSSFRSGITIIDSASGGAVGGAITGGAGGAGIAVGGNGSGTVFHTGGAGGSAITNAGGGGGGSALPGANGGDGNIGSGNTGGTGGSGQGAGGNGGDRNANGLSGTAPGGGGGGNGRGGANAGNGADGRVVISGAAGAILPVKFQGLEARMNNNSVSLKWSVGTEDNVSSYQVEKSTDGRSYANIGSVKATGEGTYSFSDNKPTTVAYYRIKSIDIDGKYGYSTVAMVKAGSSVIVLKAFPTPFINNISVQHPTAVSGSSITVSSADGRVIKTVVPAVGMQQTDINLSSAKSGMYVIRYSSINGDSETLKIVKQ